MPRVRLPLCFRTIQHSTLDAAIFRPQKLSLEPELKGSQAIEMSIEP
jgi:hypothetical protein